MSDRYQNIVRSPVGQRLVRGLGLPNPPELARYAEGDPLVPGTVLVGGSGRLAPAVSAALDDLGATHMAAADEGSRYHAVVMDATALTSSDQLVELPRFLTPLMRRLGDCPRVVVLGTPPEHAQSAAEHVAQRALEGFTRSLGKEIGSGGTVQLVYVAPGAEAAVTSTLAFLLSAKSAYVSGQVVRVGTRGETAPVPAVDWLRPLAGKVAVVTGASRGIGAEVARVLTRDGATVVGVDVPQAADELAAVARQTGGDHLALDITLKDAPARIAHHLATAHDGADVVVHNAGITRDKKLANMREELFAATIAVNLTAPERITERMLRDGAINPHGRVVGVSSVAGIGGNLGQTAYAASKAGVIGLVDSLSGQVDRSVTVNAVAPGFIETAMTATLPMMTREVGRRLNSMSQSGLPVDVAETIAWLASPASSAVNGNVVRVCGQMMLGA